MSYLDWDSYFMGVALLSAKRSKDPSTQVGACIVNEQNKIVGCGYNGFPFGCNDKDFPWGKTGDFEETKYAYVVHAELNAILNSFNNVKKSKIYVTHFPCNECAKAIIQSGISEVIYQNESHAFSKEALVAKKMFEAAGIKIYQSNNIVVIIDTKGDEKLT